jgi:hypothetical protein
MSKNKELRPRHPGACIQDKAARGMGDKSGAKVTRMVNEMCVGGLQVDGCSPGHSTEQDFQAALFAGSR